MAVLAALAVASGAGAEPHRIIDVHLHALHADDQGPPPMPVCAPFLEWPDRDPHAPPEAYGEAFTHAHCGRRLISPKTDAELQARTLAELKALDILAVTSGPADVVEAWRKAAPDRIIPGLGFGMADAPPIAELRKLHAQGRLAVIGEIGAQYDGAGPDDPRLEPYYALAEELDIPVAIHVGPGPPGAPYLGFPKYRMRLSSALLLEDVLLRHPKLRLDVMHAGWPKLDDMLALMYAHPQVYVDLGVISYVLPRAEFHRYLRTLVQAGFGRRVMFGSDNMVWPQAIAVAVANIRTAPFLSAAQKQDIMHDNAARFLRLK